MAILYHFLLITIAVALTGLIACFIPYQCRAADWTVVPELKANESYDDNLFFKNISDFEHKIAPSLEVIRNTERSHLALSGNLDILRYQDYSDYDRENQRYKLRSSYDMSSRLQLRLNGRFRRDYTFEYEFEESGIIADQNKRYVYAAQPGLSFAINEVNNIYIDFSHKKADNQGGNAVDYTSNGGNLSWSKSLLDDKTSLIAGISIEKTDFDLQSGDGEQTVYGSAFGVSRDMGPTFNVLFKIGPTWTESEFDKTTGRKDGNDLGLSVNAHLFWQAAEYTDISWKFDHGQYQSIYAENITRSRVRASIGHNFSQRWRGEAGGSYYNTQTEGYTSDQEKDTWQIGVLSSYSLRPNMSVSLGYRYRSIDEKENDFRDGNRVFVQFIVNFPKKMS